MLRNSETLESPERPPWLVPVACIAVSIPLALACALIWPFVQTLQRLYAETVSANADVLRAVLLVAIVVVIAAVLLAVLAVVRALVNLARRAAVVRLQNQAPIHVGDVRRPELRAVLESSIYQHYDVERVRAQQPYPNLTSQTYSPHVVIRTEAPAAATAVPPLSIAIPSFAELTAAGHIGRGAPLVLGVDATNGELVRGTFKSLYSVGVGGLQGSGKTWTAASILAQSATHGARLVVCDPHAGDVESLATRVAGLAPAFLCDVAEDERQILEALKLADAELQARKGGASQRWPLIVAVDEWTALRRGKLADLLPALVEDFSTEGRKFNCHIALLGQRWDKASVGDFRNTLASAFVHRLRPDEARMLTGLPAGVLPNDTMGLAPGESYLIDTRGQLRRLVTPRLTVDDVAAVGRRLAEPAAPVALPQATAPAFGFRPPAPAATAAATNQPSRSQVGAPGYSASGSAETWTPEEARIIALFEAGKDAGAIVTELTGLTSKGGRPYLQKLTDVQSVLRRALLARRGTS